MSRKKAKEILDQLLDWSLNDHSCWHDFLGVAHNEYATLNVDFSKYGYKELVMFGNALTIFNNYGYDQISELIDEVVKEKKIQLNEV